MLVTTSPFGESSPCVNLPVQFATQSYPQVIYHLSPFYDQHWLPELSVLVFCLVSLWEATLAQLACYFETRQ